MRTITKKELIEFVLNNDFAFEYGAGLMSANDDEVREGVAEIINQDGKMIEEVQDLGGAPSIELEDEKKNGCTIYKVWNYNEEPLYIAYYE